MRLFIAAPLSSEAVEWIEQIRPLTLPPQARWIPASAWHLTLLFLGETPEGKVAEIDTALQPVVPLHAPFSLTPYQIGWKDYTLWIWLNPKPSVERLVQNLHAALGLSASRPFLPHITIARRKNRHIIPPKRLHRRVPIMFREVILYQSILRAEGAEYIPLRSYPLSGAE